ncbi:hypothetical protein [uncultured Schumannella sp.]|uniref:hypothetical protein n=1 Tax=uncultured Schumannella sp. TaxID=1195956 RepID=UPI0025DE0805|nr:hypothetical protein [uncultured Schumannella sp.]
MTADTTAPDIDQAPDAEPAADAPTAPARHRLWPLWAVLAGALGFTATVLMDVRPLTEIQSIANGIPYEVTPADMDDITRTNNYLGFVLGFVAVAAMLALHGAWRVRVETAYANSIAARVVSGALLTTAAGLTLAFGWKGALANYGFDGPEAGAYGEEGLFVYYMLTDFGAYLPWLGAIIAAAAVAWMAFVERSVSRGLGAFSGILAILVAGAFVVSGVPGLSGLVGGFWLVVAGIWLSVGRSAITLKPAA